MRGSVLLAGAILGAASLVGAPSAAQASAPDPYSGGITTECSISVPAHLDVGDKVKLTVRVKANSPTPPTGKLDLAILEDSTVLWSKTVSYNGGTKTVVARSLPKGNDYRATARFRPSDNTFKRCHDSTPFAVAAVNNHNPNGNNTGGPGGLLPDTGGPALLWLLLGLGLVGGGTGAVVYSRRKQAPAPATV
jgi:LPXTG-motif cell wall-anchored protein